MQEGKEGTRPWVKIGLAIIHTSDRQVVLEINTYHVPRGRGRDVPDYGQWAYCPSTFLQYMQIRSTRHMNEP